MVIFIALAINMVASVALGLTLAFLFGPEEYGRYSIAVTIAALVGVIAFDWLRVSVARFVSPTTIFSGMLRDLRLSYGLVALLLILCSWAYVVMGGNAGVGGPLFLCAVAFAIANAWFDFNLTRARAMFENAIYGRLLLHKNILALGLGVTIALVFQNASDVLITSALCCLVAIAINRPKRTSPEPAHRPSRFPPAMMFMRYGMPLIMANIAFQAMALKSRSAAAFALGLDQAGLLSLPTDMSFRLFMVIGAALDVYFFQLVVRREHEEGADAARRQVTQNIVPIFAVLAPAFSAYLTLMPGLTRIFIPVEFRSSFGAISNIMAPGVFVVVMVSYGFNPILQLAKKTGPLIIASGFALCLQVCALLILDQRPHTIQEIAMVHSCALAISAAITCFFALRAGLSLPSFRDIAAVLAANVLLATALWPSRYLENPYLALLYASLAGPLVYGGAMLAFDLRDARQFFRRHSIAIRTALFTAEA